MRIRNFNVRVDWGHLTFVTVLIALTVLYLVEVLSISRKINNIILVVPFAILLLVLCLFVMIGTVHFARAGGSGVKAAETQENNGDYVQTRADIIRSAILLAGLGIYVMIYPLLGMDLTTFLFVAGAQFLLGERRPFFALLYATIFTLIVIGGARLLLSYPMPTLLF